MKKCSNCHQTRPTLEFQNDVQKRDGLRSICRDCRREINRSYVVKWQASRANAPEPSGKRCSKCGNTKPIEAFCRDRCRPDGFHVWCRDCRNPIARKQRAARPKDREQQQNRAYLLNCYGLTEAAYSDLLAKQGHCCAICKMFCGKPHIDHDHSTGRVRGLLCGRCNLGLGLFADDHGRLEEAIKYLCSV